MKFLLFSLASIVILLIGCQRQPQGKVIARVGLSELTLEQAQQAIDTTVGSFNEQIRNFVALWINREFLYQEAKKYGIENDPLIRNKQEEIRREIIIQKFLEQKIYSVTDRISNEEIRDYYEQHRSEFWVRDDRIRLNLVGFKNRDAARSFTSAILRGQAWNEVLEHFQTDSILASSLLVAPETRYYSQQELYPPKIWKIANELNLNEVSFAIPTEQGYFVLQKLAMVRKGDLADFNLVSDEVRARLLIQKRRERFNNLINELRQRYTVEVLIPFESDQDTLQRTVYD